MEWIQWWLGGETFPDPELARRMHVEATVKVKMEIDIDPPPHANVEVRYMDDPSLVNHFSMS